MWNSRNRILLIPLLAALLVLAAALGRPAADAPERSPAEPHQEPEAPTIAAEPPALGREPGVNRPGATLAAEPKADVVEPAPTAPPNGNARTHCTLNLCFRDMETGEILPAPTRIWVQLERGGSRATAGSDLPPSDDEWTFIVLDAQDMERLETGAKLKVALRGYAWTELTPPWSDTPREIPVMPLRPSARGSVAPLPGGREGRITATVGARWFRDTRDASPSPRELPDRTGTFRLDDLAPGVYELEVAAEVNGAIVRARRTFEVGGETVDLGEITLTRYAGIRARVVDAAGRPVLQTDVVVVRAEESPDNARRLTPGMDGWVSYEDLEPDYNHRVVVLGLPYSLDRIVRTPGRFGETAETEFKISDRQVDCDLEFLLSSADIVDAAGNPIWMEVPLGRLKSDLPLSRFAWVDGVSIAGLLAGTYTFRLDVDDGVEATITIPRRPVFSAQVLFRVDRGD